MKANLGNYLKNNKEFSFDLNRLVKHFAAFGGSGSGKTVFSKVIIEESIKNNIPSIIIDPQGDLASLALPEGDFKPDVNIFTPGSNKGIPLSINPLKMPKDNGDSDEIISILDSMSNSITSLIGYDLDKDKGKQCQALLYQTLTYAHDKSLDIRDIRDLIELLKKPDEINSDFYEEKIAKEIIKKLKFLTVGEKEILFNSGVTLDIDLLLSKPQINIIYLNSLKGAKEKEFFISILALQLYEWMLNNPSKNLQALFFIDEIADYIPAGALKPATKDILKLIYKQARKYGVGCMVSTQNPGDIDYKAFAQFGTWAIGRLTTKQDREKVKEAMKSMAGNKIEDLILKMPKLKPGEFLFFCPDEFSHIQEIKSRWLLTKHETLTENDVKKIMVNKKEEFVPLQKKEYAKKKESKKSQHKHFELKIKENELDNIIKKHKKKMFVFFGPEKEKLISKSLVWKPIFKTTMRLTKKRLFGKVDYKDLIILFDALDGNIIVSQNGYSDKYLGMSKLLDLTERELSLVKELTSGKNKTNAELASKLDLTDNFVNSTMNSLMKKKIVSHSGRLGKAYLWKNITRIEFGDDINKFESTVDLHNNNIIQKQINPKVNIKHIEFFIRNWFMADLMSHELIFYPEYELHFAKKTQSRTVLISGVTGKAI